MGEYILSKNIEINTWKCYYNYSTVECKILINIELNLSYWNSQIDMFPILMC